MAESRFEYLAYISSKVWNHAMSSGMIFDSVFKARKLFGRESEARFLDYQIYIDTSIAACFEERCFFQVTLHWFSQLFPDQKSIAHIPV